MPLAVTRYITAFEKWQGSRDPYSSGVGSPETPRKPRSVLRDVFQGLYQLYTVAWSDSKLALIPILLLTIIGFPIAVAFLLAYWAMWEKLATYWWHTTGYHLGRTQGSFSIPAWHRYFAVLVGLFWGILVAVPFIAIVGVTAATWRSVVGGT